MTVTIRPDSDVTNTNIAWSGGASSMWETLDEVSPSDSDFIRSVALSTATAVLGFTTPSPTPSGPDDGTLRIRERIQNLVDDPVTLNIQISSDGGSNVSALAAADSWSGSFTTREFTIPNSWIAAVSDWATVEVTIIADGFVDDAGCRIQVSWLEVELPVLGPIVGSATMSLSGSGNLGPFAQPPDRVHIMRPVMVGRRPRNFRTTRR